MPTLTLLSSPLLLLLLLQVDLRVLRLPELTTLLASRNSNIMLWVS
jgi:hypothetical protein